MVPEHEVVSQLHHSFNVVWIALFEKQEEFGLDSCLVVVLLLVLNELDSNLLFVFVVNALDYLAKCSFSDYFDQLESISNMIVLLHFVVTFIIVEAIVD